jgi:AcrR family transcriptional regulator
MPLHAGLPSEDNAAMGRTREFDTESMLEQATRLFWRLGYDAVTIQDVEAATGLGRGSLYHAYADKEGLFLAVLDSYLENYGSAPLRHLDCPDVAQGIQRMLKAIVARMSDPANPRGCLLTNTTLVAIGGSGRIEAKVAEAVAGMQAHLEEAIARARRERQIPRDADPKALAHFYSAVAQGLGVVHKASGDRSALNDIVAIAMRAWPGSADRRAAKRKKQDKRAERGG